MGAARALFLLAGLALFAWIVGQADTAAVAREVLRVGVAGFVLVLAVYALEFLCDVLAWQLILPAVPGSLRWTARLYAVRMAGEAWNVVTPLGGMGGEPLKALILKRRYGVPYAAAGASVVLALTTNVVALLLFLAAGFGLMVADARIPPEVRSVAGIGLAALALGVIAFVLLQRLRVTSRLAGRLARNRPRLEQGLAALRQFDQHLVAFYGGDRVRFALVLGLGLVNWVLGVVGVWVALAFMGRPVAFLDAWIIEAMAQLVRAATFFIPASLGALEGVIVLMTGVITGDAASGLALALVRRGRDLLWVLSGLALSAPLAAPARDEPP